MEERKAQYDALGNYVMVIKWVGVIFEMILWLLVLIEGQGLHSATRPH